ncbi:hypothetical protein B9G54_01505 [Alloscardovia macacae]|uniref:Uncharacterized protein n=1 Tax=Alloscardovia macacae TaxID=1160091 RepID=A0A1Y2T1T9_9BIFI|nr:hypothetical protein [Alloscardovia macacae]OTA27222.1 hypothetical protein B9G54_01505 [Alloscardovia macacae]OTA29232.1 hypothetical protein B9T39_03700 [Alloscardovia macacae]
MTLELIIGKAGTPHIDGNDIGTLNQAIRGAGSYILEWGNNLTATVTGSNTVQIGTGAGTMEGRDFIISAAENVTIQSGSQGMKRNDLICLHYNRSSSTGVETMNLVALKGYATSSNPRDPSVPSGTIMGGSLDAYWPLYRVPLDGIRIGTPVRLVEMLPSLRNLHSRLLTDDPIKSSVYGYINSGGMLAGHAIGKIVSITVSGSNAVSTAAGVTLGTVKDEYRPLVSQQATFGLQNGTWGVIRVEAGGRIVLSHLYNSANLTWQTLYQTLTYVAG